MNSSLDHVSQAKPLLVIVTPSPKQALRINGDRALSSQTHLREDDVLGAQLDLLEVFAFFDIHALTEQTFLASSC